MMIYLFKASNIEKFFRLPTNYCELPTHLAKGASIRSLAEKPHENNPDLPGIRILSPGAQRNEMNASQYLAASCLFFLIQSLCGLVSAQSGESAEQNQPAGRPNIIFMMADDQGWGGTSVQMHPAVADSRSKIFRTPNLESLSNEGMRFSQAYAPASVCAPTRLSILNGQSPAANHWTKVASGLRSLRNPKMWPPEQVRRIDTKDVTFAELLQSSGYRTSHYGKWHIGGGGPGKHGFDEHDGDIGNEYAERFTDPNPVDIFGMCERAEKFMAESRDAGKPFYIQLSWHALHSPWNALKKTTDKYRNSRGRQSRFAAITEDLDTGVGRILESVDKLDLRRNTWVIYTSDNGSGSSQVLAGGKGSLWEGGIRVPMIVRGPGVEANSWCHTPVVLSDMYPTFCEWAGVELPEKAVEQVEGGSIVSLLNDPDKGQVSRARKELYFHFPNYQTSDGPHSAIIADEYKLVHFWETGDSRLFNLASDIQEKKDLAAEKKDLVADLEARLKKYLEDVDAHMAAPNPKYDPNVATQTGQRGGGGQRGGRQRRGMRGGRGRGNGRPQR